MNTIWVGTTDGLIQVTRDGGAHWQNVTPPGMTPWSNVTQLEASHFDDETAYASVSRFFVDDLKPYIYRTHDGGKTWKLIVNGLPDDAPANVVREDPVRKGLLFAGTERAVWFSADDGDHWQSLQLNLPVTSMRDLAVHDDDLVVATHGRSDWILDDITPLRQLTAAAAATGAFLYKPAPAYQIPRNTYTDTQLEPEFPAGQNPPSGAIIDYYLKAAASGPVTLEIVDAAGKLVRRYASTDKPTQLDPDTLNFPTYWLRPPQVLSAQAGMHRFVWDLHYPSPHVLRPTVSISVILHDSPDRAAGACGAAGTLHDQTDGGRTHVYAAADRAHGSEEQDAHGRAHATVRAGHRAQSGHRPDVRGTAAGGGQRREDVRSAEAEWRTRGSVPIRCTAPRMAAPMATHRPWPRPRHSKSPLLPISIARLSRC